MTDSRSGDDEISRTLDRLRDMIAARVRAEQLRREYGDPIEGLGKLGDELIGDSPEARESWERIIREYH